MNFRSQLSSACRTAVEHIPIRAWSGEELRLRGQQPEVHCTLEEARKQRLHFCRDVIRIAEHASIFADAHCAEIPGPFVHVLE